MFVACSNDGDSTIPEIPDDPDGSKVSMLSRGGTLSVVGASERLRRVMKLAGLEKLPIWDDTKEVTHL